MRQRLTQLQMQVQRRAELKNRIVQLEEELSQMEKDLFALKIEAHNQQADVDTLKQRSIKNMLLDLTGRKLPKLEKEEAQARNAHNAYNNALFQNEQSARQLEVSRMELDSLRGCENEYWLLLRSDLSGLSETDRQWVQNARRDRAKELLGELEKATVSVGYLTTELEGTKEHIRNIRQWNSALSGSAWNMTMPGYLLGTQKKLDRLAKLAQKLTEVLPELPVPWSPDQISAPLFTFPAKYLQEILSKSTADERLLEALKEIKNTQSRLPALLSLLRNTAQEIAAETAADP